MVRHVSKQPIQSNILDCSENRNNDTIQADIETKQKLIVSDVEDKDTLDVQDISGDMKDLDAQIETMVDQGGSGRNNMKGHVCKVCGKAGTPTYVRRHIEANHLEGISIPCNFCEKSVKSRHALRQHRSRHHLNTN